MVKTTDIFSAKELQVIALMAPGKTADEIISLVLRDWFKSNSERLYASVKTDEEKMDEIIAKKSVK